MTTKQSSWETQAELLTAAAAIQADKIEGTPAGDLLMGRHPARYIEASDNLIDLGIWNEDGELTDLGHAARERLAIVERSAIACETCRATREHAERFGCDCGAIARPAIATLPERSARDAEARHAAAKAWILVGRRA